MSTSNISVKKKFNSSKAGEALGLIPMIITTIIIIVFIFILSV
jgi:hypothetical protein